MTSRFLNLDRDGTLAANSDEIVPSQKAIKTYADNKVLFYGTSTSAAADTEKVVSIPSVDTLSIGTIIIIKPTITSTVANSTIKLNNFNAYPMRYNNAAITTSTDSIVWNAAYPSIWVFDGTYWVFAGHGVDSNTTYSAMSVAEGIAGTATSSRVIRADYLKQIIENYLANQDVMGGATASADGSKGLVPAPSAGDNLKFLRGDGTWAAAGGSANIDNKSITQNNDSQIQTIGVIDQNSGNAIKKWSGTEAEFEAITNKDLDTEYTIEDDEDVPVVNSPSFNRNIGELVPSVLPLSDAGLHLLDGALISGSGSYSAFVDYIATLAGNYPNLFTTESNWQAAITANGVCGKFVYDASANTVRLPKITGIIEGTTDISALGELVAAGLPSHTHSRGSMNITGTFGKFEAGYANYSGAFYNAGNIAGRHTSSGSTGIQYGFNAANSWTGNTSAPQYSSAIGTSNTVQPQTIKVHYYIVIANTTKTEIQVDIDQIATDLNGKADTDLSNVNNTGKSTGAGWAMPSGTYVDLTLGASGSTYTAPANGWFVIRADGNAANSGGILTNTSNGIGDSFTTGDSGSAWVLLTCPALKGQVVLFDYSSLTTVYWFRFIYAEGSKSEA